MLINCDHLYGSHGLWLFYNCEVIISSGPKQFNWFSLPGNDYNWISNLIYTKGKASNEHGSKSTPELSKLQIWLKKWANMLNFDKIEVYTQMQSLQW